MPVILLDDDFRRIYRNKNRYFGMVKILGRIRRISKETAINELATAFPLITWQGRKLLESEGFIPPPRKRVGIKRARR